MIRFRFLSILFALLLLAFAAGCTRSPGGVAPSNIPLAPGGYTEIGRAKGSDCKVNLLGILPLSGGNRLDQALEKAVRDGNGDALVNITVDRNSKFFILWSQTCTIVYGTAVRLQPAGVQ